jgi:hypothetical protein
MVVKHLPRVHTLLVVLAEPTMAPLRACLVENGRFPSRRTWERRLDDLPATLPILIRLLGQALLGVLDVWPTGGAAVAIDSTVLRAHGGSGTRRIGRLAPCHTPRLTPTPTGPNRAGTAGCTAGSSIS